MSELKAIERRTVAVEGMTCQGCVGNVRNAATSVDGVDSVVVSLEKGTATISTAVSGKVDIILVNVVEAIQKAGFKAHLEKGSKTEAKKNHQSRSGLRGFSCRGRSFFGWLLPNGSWGYPISIGIR